MFPAPFNETPAFSSKPDLCFSPDIGSFPGHKALDELDNWKVVEKPRIQFHAFLNKKNTYDVYSFAWIDGTSEQKIKKTKENKKEEALRKHALFGYNSFTDMPEYAVKQFFRFAEKEALCLDIFQNYSRGLTEQLKKMNEDLLDSLPHAAMSVKELAALPLPYFMTTKKRIIPHTVNECGEIVTQEEQEIEDEEIQRRLEDKDASDQYEEEQDAIEEEAEVFEEKHNVDVTYTKKRKRPTINKNETLLYRGVSDRFKEIVDGRMEDVDDPQQFIALLQKDKNGPYYRIMEMSPLGMYLIGDILPENGELVGPVVRFLSNIQEVIMDPLLQEDMRYALFENAYDFDCEKIEDYAHILDEVHIARLPPQPE